MDLLYAKYANPMDLMKMYINRGRFGEFVNSVLEAEYERKKEQAEKEDDLKLWMMYVHSYSDKTFLEWKNCVLQPEHKGKTNRDSDLDDEGIKKIMDDLF